MSRRTRSRNAFATQLSANITSGALSIPLDSTTGLIAPGYLVIEPNSPTLREYIKFTGVSGSDITGLTRGLDGSANGAQGHDGGKEVRAVPTHQHLDDLFDDVEDLEDHVGSGGTEHPAATALSAGFLSATDKAILDGLVTHADEHGVNGNDPIGLVDIDARARGNVRIDAQEPGYARRTHNFITDDGDNGIDMSIADNPTTEAVDITISHGTYPTGDPHNQYVHKSGYTEKGTLISASAAGTVETIDPPASFGAQAGDDQALVSAFGEAGGMKWLPLVPPGALMPYAGTTDPAGFAICDGRTLSRTTYERLFDVIGTTFGVGDGSTTFNIPDMRQRFPVGATGAGDYGLGDTGGAETVTLTTAQIPTHAHGSGSYTTGNDQHNHTAGILDTGGVSANHKHNITSQSSTNPDHTHEGGAGTVAQAITGGGSASTAAIGINDSGHTHDVQGSTQDDTHNHNVTGTSGTAGSGNAHENRPPFIALNFIIKL